MSVKIYYKWDILVEYMIDFASGRKGWRTAGVIHTNSGDKNHATSVAKSLYRESTDRIRYTVRGHRTGMTQDVINES